MDGGCRDLSVDEVRGDRRRGRGAAPKDHANDGEHVVEFYSVDNALNQEAVKSVTVKIDTRPPHFAWKSVSPGVIRRIEPVTCASPWTSGAAR